MNELDANPLFNSSMAGNPMQDRLDAGVDVEDLFGYVKPAHYKVTTEDSTLAYKRFRVPHDLGYCPYVIGRFTDGLGVTRQLGANNGIQMWVADVTERYVEVGYFGIGTGSQYKVELLLSNKERV